MPTAPLEIGEPIVEQYHIRKIRRHGHFQFGQKLDRRPNQLSFTYRECLGKVPSGQRPLDEHCPRIAVNIQESNGPLTITCSEPSRLGIEFAIRKRRCDLYHNFLGQIADSRCDKIEFTGRKGLADADPPFQFDRCNALRKLIEPLHTGVAESLRNVDP